jgi:hypothetical protein
MKSDRRDFITNVLAAAVLPVLPISVSGSEGNVIFPLNINHTGPQAGYSP